MLVMVKLIDRPRLPLGFASRLARGDKLATSRIRLLLSLLKDRERIHPVICQLRACFVDDIEPNT